MYETDEYVQQQQLTQCDLIVPRGADLQRGVVVNTQLCNAAKVNSQVQTLARAMWAVN